MKSNLGNILKKEMRELFRDRKSLAMMLIIPVFIPLIIIGMSALFESQINKGVEEYNRIGFGYELSQVERELASQMEIEAVQGSPEQLASDYENGEIDLYITKKGNTYTINSDGSDTASYATGLAERYLEVYRQHLQQEYLAAEGVDPEAVFDILTVEENVIEGDNYFAGYNGIGHISGYRYYRGRAGKRDSGNSPYISCEEQRYNSRKVHGGDGVSSRDGSRKSGAGHHFPDYR